jgi:hypothetical protein
LINVLLGDILWLMERFAEKIRLRKNISLLKQVDWKIDIGERLSRKELIFLYNLGKKSDLLSEEDKIKRRQIALRDNAIKSLDILNKDKQQDAVGFIKMVYLSGKGYIENMSKLLEDSVYIGIRNSVMSLGLESFFDDLVKGDIFCHNENPSGRKYSLGSVERCSNLEDSGFIVSQADGTTKIVSRRF